MADSKISQLTSATTPLSGTEVVPIVQNGVTKKVPVSAIGGGGGLNFTSVSYSYTGPADPIASIILTTPTPNQIGGTVESITGSSAYLINFGDKRALSLELTNLQFLATSFSPTTMNELTTLSLPALTTLGGNFGPAAPLLTTLSLPALQTVGGDFAFSTMNALTTLSLPALQTVGGRFTPSGLNALTTLSLPALKTVGSNFAPATMPALTTLNLTALAVVGGSFSPSPSSLTTLSLPALTAVGVVFSPNSMSTLTTISTPAIEQIGYTLTSGDAIKLNSGTAALTNFQLPNTLKRVGGTAGNVTITSAALNQTSVDSILVALAALNGNNGTTTFNNRTVTITGTSSTPSATGLAAKATLVARGCTVTHN